MGPIKEVPGPDGIPNLVLKNVTYPHSNPYANHQRQHQLRILPKAFHIDYRSGSAETREEKLHPVEVLKRWVRPLRGQATLIGTKRPTPISASIRTW